MKQRLKRMDKSVRAHRFERGVGIIEVLVALVVISLGVLGMAGLQLTGIKNTNNSYNRSKALMLIENLATRMRSNREAVENSTYAGFDASTDVDCAVPPNPYCQAAPGQTVDQCTSVELAAFDLFSVSCGVAGTGGANDGVLGILPDNSNLQVICNDIPCLSDSSYTLTVSWTERTSASDDTALTRNISMRLRP